MLAVGAIELGLYWMLRAGRLSEGTFGIVGVLLSGGVVALLAYPSERAMRELKRNLEQLEPAEDIGDATKSKNRAGGGRKSRGLATRLEALVDARQAAERRSQSNSRAVRHLLRAQHIAGVGSWEWDRGTHRLECSDEVYRILGMDHGQRDATPALLFRALHKDDRRALRRWLVKLASGNRPAGIDLRARAWNGRLLRLRLRGEALQDRDKGIRGIVGIVQDATEYAEALDNIHRLAYYDALTELPNRTRFRQELLETLTAARGRGESFAILFVDLDQFKRVNDTLGHASGDDLLRIVAQRLTRVSRSEEVAVEPFAARDRSVCRQGGDEFIVLLRGVANEDHASRAARRLLDALQQPFLLGSQEMFMSASIGVVLYPRDGEDLDTLLKNADIAMYHAKSDGRNRHSFYRPEMREATANRLVLEHGLRRAIEAEQFELYYQPQLDVRSGSIVGVEALIRWNHPTLGLLGPKQFIGIAEDAGLIMAIWEWVFVTALIQLVTWREAGLPAVTMGVNLSSVQFADAKLASRVEEVARGVGAPFEAIELEITESVLMRDFDGALLTLAELRKLGVKIAIDDFGTGYSSLSYLRRLPLDKLKLDMAFIGDAMRSKEAAAITRAIITMGKSLELAVVAEGVETQAQLEFLAGAGCSTMQGYLLGRPVPAAAMTELLCRGHSPRASTTVTQEDQRR
jgi:diguanylate cyclase (GGDEF)-like protein